jgi:hypothetical protein
MKLLFYFSSDIQSFLPPKNMGFRITLLTSALKHLKSAYLIVGWVGRPYLPWEFQLLLSCCQPLA